MTEKHEASVSSNTSLRNVVLFLLSVGLVLGCVWRFSPLYHRLGFETLVEWGKFLQGHPWTPVGVILVFMVGGLVFFVHAVLLWVVVFTFDTAHAFIYCEVGSLASAILMYSLGRVLRRDVIKRLTGSYAGEVSRALAHKGVTSLFLLHFFPVCPFSVLNLLAGATHIDWTDFLIGTTLGMTPGILFLCLFGNRFVTLIRHPNWEGFVGLTVFVIAGFWAFTYVRRGFRKKSFS